jgi:hypothetical protein
MNNMLSKICNTHQYIDVDDEMIWVNLDGKYKIGEIVYDVRDHVMIEKSSLPIYKMKPEEVIEINYIDITNNKKYTQIERNELFDQLLRDTHTHYNDCSKEYESATLDDEYNFKKRRMWFSALKQEIIYSEQEWEIVNLECIGEFKYPKNPYLNNGYVIGKSGYRNSNLYSIKKYTFITDLFKKYEETYDIKFIDVNPDLKFMKYKLGDSKPEFVFYSNEDYYIDKYTYPSLEKAEEEFWKWKEIIEAAIFKRIFGNKLAIPTQSYEYINSSLKSILGSVKILNVHKKDSISHRALVEMIKGVIDNIDRDMIMNNPSIITIEVKNDDT